MLQIRPERQTLLWSATWPKEIQSLAREFLSNAYQVGVCPWVPEWLAVRWGCLASLKCQALEFHSSFLFSVLFPSFVHALWCARLLHAWLESG